MLVNVVAVVYGAIVAVNIAWPRAAVYDALAGTKDAAGNVIPSHWYWQYIAILFIGIVVIIGSIYYFAVYGRKPIEVLGSTPPRCRLPEARRWARWRRDRSADPSLSEPPAAPLEVTRFLRAHPAVRRARRRTTVERVAAGGRGRVPSRRDDDLLAGRRARSSTCGSSAAARSRSSTTAACSTCSARASCSATRRCCRGCRPASRRARPRTRSATGSRPTSRASLLPAPAGLRFVARSLLEAPAELAGSSRASRRATPPHQPVGALIRGAPVVCGPDTPIREAAQMMTAASGHVGRRATSATARSGSSPTAICARACVAAGLPGDAPVSAAMSAPAYTCRPDRLGGEVLLDMLDRGLPPLPGRVGRPARSSGVVEDLDLVAVQTRSSFFLRQRIARAQSVEELVARRRRAAPDGVAMHDAGVAAAEHHGRLRGRRRRAHAPAARARGRSRRGARGAVRVARARQPGAARGRPELGRRQRDRVVRRAPTRHEIRPYLHARRRRRSSAGSRRCGFRADEHGRDGVERARSCARSSPGSARRAAGSRIRPRRRR